LPDSAIGRTGAIFGFAVTGELCGLHIRLKFSASFIKRQSGTERPFAMLSATVRLGVRSPRSTREIIFEDKLAFSANFS